VRSKYLFRGEEEFFSHQAIAKLKAAVIPVGFEDFAVEYFYPGEGDLAQFLSQLRAIPFGGGSRLGIVWGVKQLKEADQALLMEYLTAPSPTAVLVIQTEPDLNKKKFAELARHTTVIDFPSLKGEELFNYLRALGREKGLGFDKAALERLVELVGEDIAELASELEKLSLLLGDSRLVTVELVDSITAGSRYYNPWALSQAIGERNRTKALKVLHNLLDAKTPPQKLLRPVVRELFSLLKLKGLGALSSDELAQRLGSSPGAIYYLKRRAASWKPDELASALKALNQIDLDTKKGKGEFEPLFESFILRFATQA
jgi:DNA polymerase-3 subunit delta